jgi:hypothetical protein
MVSWLKLLILAVAGYFAYDYLVAKEHWKDWQLPSKTEVPPNGAKPEELQRSPGRGLNPFVMDDMPGAPPQRPRIPDVPGGAPAGR